MTNAEVTPAGAPATVEAAGLVEERKRFPALSVEHGIGEAYDSAPDIDALLADLPDAEGIKEYLGRPITVHGASLRIGEIDGKATLYVMLDVTDNSSGKRVAVSTGADAVMKQVNRAAQLDVFPFECMPYAVELGKRGQDDPIHLGKVDRF